MLFNKTTDKHIERSLTTDFIDRHTLVFRSSSFKNGVPSRPSHGKNPTPWKVNVAEVQQVKKELEEIQQLFDFDHVRTKTMTPLISEYKEQLVLIGAESCIDIRSVVKLMLGNVEHLITSGDRLDDKVQELEQVNQELISENATLEQQLLDCNHQLNYSSGDSYTVNQIDSTGNTITFSEGTLKKALAAEKYLRGKYFKGKKVSHDIEQYLIDKYFKPAKQSNVASILIAGDEEHYQSFSMNTIMFADIIFQFLSRGSDTAVVLKDRTGEFGHGAHVRKADVKRVVAEEL